jgi:hypothetical protein
MMGGQLVCIIVQTARRTTDDRAVEIGPGRKTSGCHPLALTICVSTEIWNGELHHGRK